MINMAVTPLYMWEMWDVTPVTHERTDERTVESRAVFSLSWIRNYSYYWHYWCIYALSLWVQLVAIYAHLVCKMFVLKIQSWKILTNLMSDQRTVLKIKLKSNMTKPKTFWHSMTSSYEAPQVMARSPARVVWRWFLNSVNFLGFL